MITPRKLFLLIAILAALVLTGCEGESNPTLPFNFPIPTDLRLSGIINLSDVAVHKDLGGITPSLLDLRPFTVKVQDDLSGPATVDEQGLFTLSPISIRDQVVLFCQHGTNKNLVLEWMAATSAGLYGEMNVTVDLRSTARSMIARSLRERYGRRIRPEELKTEHISATVNAIADVLEKYPTKLSSQPLNQIAEVKAAYTAMADSLHAGNSGAYPNEHVLLLHMGGDNSLSSYIGANIEDIALAGLPSGTQILIQVDTRVDGFKRLMLQKNKFVELVSLGKFDSSSGLAIADFMTWARRAFPARRYSLIISSHADGWKSSASLPSTALRNSLIVDDSAEKKGNVIEIAAYIAGAAANFDGSRRPLELLAFDACNMGSIEVAWEFRNCAAATVFSQAMVPAAGFPYGKIVKSIAGTGSDKLDGETLGRIICDEYRKKYLEGIITQPVTVSMIRNSAFASFISRLNAWFIAVNNERDQYAKVLAGLRDHLEFVVEDGEKKYVVQAFEKAENRDLKSFVSNAAGPLTRIKIDTENLLREFPGLIVCNYHSQKAFPGATGLSVTLPDRQTWFSEFVGPSPSPYFFLAFARETLWPDLLAAINAVE
ncbi:MAG TPA: clostripain-related cysteine peptidase [Candidatus Rifleibacterium sp.]|nr:clostripain-related cysteine peptidase [Candidatus Rifleibacterium sp.]